MSIITYWSYTSIIHHLTNENMANNHEVGLKPLNHMTSAHPNRNRDQIFILIDRQ